MFSLPRPAAFAAGLLLAAPVLASFFGGPARADDARPLAVVAPWEITGLDPARSGYVFARLQIAETLVTADDGGRPVASLAQAWTTSDDRLVWRFGLRPDAVFHDGTPVTADAAVASLRRARANAAGVLAGLPIVAIEAEPGAVVIRTERPFLSLPAFLAHSSTIVLAPAAYDGAGAVTAMIGTGPYRATVVEPPLKVEAVRFDRWWGPAPRIARLSYLAVGRGETRTVMAESGQADIVHVLAPEAIERLRRNSRLAVTVLPVPRTRAVKLNAGRPPFSDVRAREAFSLAIDREGIAAALLRSPPSAATQMFPPGLGDWHVAGMAPLRHDPARAKALLAEAGWRPGPDGILAKDGTPFRVTLRTFSDRPELPPVATAMQGQLKDVGIDLRVAIVNSGEIPAGHRDGTLDLALFARNFALVPDPLGTMLQDFGPQGGDWGAMGWSSQRLGEILAALGAEADPARQAALRGEVARILQAELPVVPIAWYDYAVAANRRVTDVSVDPLELSYRIAAMGWAR
jgi:peptide/nickel transport system substrate-binding protein